MKLSVVLWYFFEKHLGNILILSGIAGFALALLYLKGAAEVVAAFLAVTVIVFGIYVNVVYYEAEHHLDHWMD